MVTKAKLRVLEARVESSMTLPGVEAQGKVLPLDRLYSLLEQAEDALPGILTRLINDAQKKDTSPTTRLRIFDKLASFVLAQQRLERDMGLVKGMISSVNGDPNDVFAQLLGSDPQSIKDVDARLLELSETKP